MPTSKTVSGTIIFDIDRLTTLVTDIFLNAGLSEQQAQSVAGVIVAGERDGCKSHGIYRIDGCLRTLAAGKVRPRAVPLLHNNDDTGIIRVDACDGFSPAAFALGVDSLIERTARLGIAAMVINNCTHFSALWPEIEMLTARGYAALAMCPSYSTVAPAGGTTPLLGTNPLAFGWPRPGRNPYVFDFATSIVARGEVELHRRERRPLPEGWALDARGEPTTDAEAALGGAMLPFGAHKGSAISTMIELLAGAMIGDLISPEALEYLGTTEILPHHGELIVALSPEHFSSTRSGDPFTRAETLFDAIIGQGARLPSQRRFDARAKAYAEGIILTESEVAELSKLRERSIPASDE